MTFVLAHQAGTAAGEWMAGAVRLIKVPISISPVYQEDPISLCDANVPISFNIDVLVGNCSCSYNP